MLRVIDINFCNEVCSTHGSSAAMRRPWRVVLAVMLAINQHWNNWCSQTVRPSISKVNFWLSKVRPCVYSWSLLKCRETPPGAWLLWKLFVFSMLQSSSPVVCTAFEHSLENVGATMEWGAPNFEIQIWGGLECGVLRILALTKSVHHHVFICHSIVSLTLGS